MQRRGADLGGPDTADVGRLGDPEAWRALGYRVVVVLAAAALIAWGGADPVLELLLIGFATVFTIVTDQRFRWERRIESLGIPSRELWASVGMVALLIGLGYVTAPEAWEYAADKLDIIAFILAFALLAEGLGRSGFFNYMAYQFTERCHGNTNRLIIYLFLLSSAATYVTSNDIVILIMTPIVLQVARRAGLRNAKLLLLSQFVAANTVSMGLLIGSPTNLIVGQDTGLNFFSYAFVMFIPTLVALMGTMVVIDWINQLATAGDADTGRTLHARLAPFLGRTRNWAFQPTYRTPRFTEFNELTSIMRRWVWILGASVVLVIVVTFSEWDLYWAAAPITAVTLATLALETPAPRGDRARKRGAELGKALHRLPYGIVFFGAAFFVLAAVIGQQNLVRSDITTTLADLVNDTPLLGGVLGVLGAGALTNMLNDLPASALLGGILAQISDAGGFATPFARALATQVTLIGVNLGTYVTPVGALAGIIWFDRLRQDRQRASQETQEVADMAVPNRTDLFVYGLSVFTVLAVLTGVTSFTVLSVADWLLGPTRGPSVVGNSPARVLATVLGLGLLGFVVVALRRQLKVNRVLLVHMVDVFHFANRVRYWIARHRLGWAAIVTSVALVVAAAALYWVETFHAATYDLAAPFSGVGGFINWFTVIVTSGFDRTDGPRSILGVILAGMLALGSIAAILYLIRASTQGGTATFRQRVAAGEIPFKRLVVMNATDDEEELVAAIIATRGNRFVVAVGAEGRSSRLAATFDRDDVDRAAFVAPRSSTAEAVSSLDLASAREIVLLSRTSADDFANIALLMALDEELGRRTPLTSSDDEDHLGILFLAFMSQTKDLLATRVSAEMLRRTEVITVGQEFTEFVAAHTSGDPRRLSAFFAAHGTSGAGTPGVLGIDGRLATLDEESLPADVTAAVNRALLDHLGSDPTGIDTRGPWTLRTTIDRLVSDGLRTPSAAHTAAGSSDAAATARGQALFVGVAIDDDGARDHLTLADLTRAAAPRKVVGAVTLRDREAGATPALPQNPPAVLLVGGGDLLASCAERLVAEGRDVTVVHPVDDRVGTRLADLDGIRLLACPSEQHAANTLSQHAAATPRTVVFDNEAPGPWHIERLLELVSLDRMAMIAEGRTPPPLMVQCTGRGRRERLARFIVDEVVDSAWIARSYFQLFIAGYFGALHGEGVDEDPEQTGPGTNRFLAAHLAALTLMRFQAIPAHLLTLQVPQQGPQEAQGMAYEEVLAASRLALGLSGPVIGGARFTPHIREDGKRELRLRLISALDAAEVSGTDVLLLIPHL